MKKVIAILTVLVLVLSCGFCFAEADGTQAEATEAKPYTLEQVVILSRHNLRAPLSSNGSVPNDLTPHSWIQWTDQRNKKEKTKEQGNAPCTMITSCKVPLAYKQLYLL